MDFRICFIIFITILRYSEECEVIYISSKCQYNMICEDVMDEYESWNKVNKRVNYGYSSYDVMDTEPCSSTITYGGYERYPVNLVYRNENKDPAKSVPLTSNYGSAPGIFHVIYSFDLSNNNYDYTPDIKSMPNLVVLDLSKNQLTKAVLSNKYDLNMLQEIDLSYNTISDIQVRNYEHPYSLLKKINISHNYLVKIPDAVFDKFDGLEILDLSYNYIESMTPFTFEGTRNLLNLYLSNNRLTDINSCLFRFSKLQVLSLGGNKIKDIKLSDFEKLNNLQFLDLSSNFIKKIDYNVFLNMDMLNNLDLSNNQLEVVSKDTFSNLHLLSSIDLSRNKFKSLPKGLFKNRIILNFSVSDNMLEGSLSKGMFEGINVTYLDLSNQLLRNIEDYAFYDLIRLEILLLNDNRIQSLSNMSFKTLNNLKQLDLSNNEIVSLDFNKDDLTNLQSLLLKNNKLVEINHEHFYSLNNLEYLDLSENTISRLEARSFKSLRNLMNLRISENPLSGTLETDTFDGLVLLPALDISRNLLTIIQNASFNGMNQLKELNISHCKLTVLQYNAFVNTGYIEVLDLSYNTLEHFFVNMSDLVGLGTLLLNNNLVKSIAPASLQGLSRLNNISLAHNAIESIHSDIFNNLIDLRCLDISYNEKLNFTGPSLGTLKNLDFIDISGIRTDIHFSHVENSAITKVVLSNASIHNITALKLSRLSRLNNLVLSYNNISKIEIGDFSGVTTLLNLDLSFNKISFIQPGAFKNNSLLFSLNISHNALSMIGYGIFRGLIYLTTLDVSYNNIKDLRTERFYEVKSLSHLIVDHNKIISVDADEFTGTSLSKLSIGDNPLPCHILVKLKNNNNFEITAIKKDEHSGENIDGVTCNKDHFIESKPGADPAPGKNDILMDIKYALYNISYNSHNTNTAQVSNYTKYLQNITNMIEKSNKIGEQNLLNIANLTSGIIELNLANFTSRITDLNNETNLLIKAVLKLFNYTTFETTTTAPVIKIDKNNGTVDPIFYINKIKKELEKTIADEKINVINELESRFSLIYHQTESLPTSNERLVSSNEGTKSIFTETCVALILLILVCLILYKFYKSRMFIRNRLSFSTRELPGAMENSAL